MIEITDANLTTVGDTTFAEVLLIMQAELEVAVFTGTGTVLVTQGERLANFGGSPSETYDLPPIDVPGFEGVINDLHLSSLFAGWTTEHGGSLQLRAVFEEEGVEARGGLVELDLDHLELDVYLVPSLDANTVVWRTELGVETDGGLLGDALRRRLETEILASPLTESIADTLEPLLGQLNLVLGLPIEGGIASFDVDRGIATFDDALVGTRQVDVVFDAVEVQDDGDGIGGQGELTFAATVNGIDSGFSDVIAAGSGTIVPLEGSVWRTSLTTDENDSVSARFEAHEHDGGNVDSLGTIDVDLDPDDAPSAFRLTAPTQNYTLLGRLELRGDVERPPHTRHLRVTVPSVQVLHDHDSGGGGDLQFWALVADQPTGVSAEAEVHGSDDPDLPLATAGGDPLEVELYLPEGDDLEVLVIGWDNDPSQRDWLGEATAVIPAGAIGVGDGTDAFSDTGDFIASIRVVDLDAPDDADDGDDDGDDDEPEETVARLVVFDTLTVEHDGELGAGEILATATANGHALGNPEPIDTSAGTALALVGDEWRALVDVPVTGTLDLSAAVTDVDGRVDDADQHNDEFLGRASLSFGAEDDFGLGSQVMSDGDGDGDFTFRLRILDPAAVETGDVQATVVFEEIEILHDHTTFGRGAFWASGSVAGFPVGTSDRFEAGRGDAIVLDGRAWTAKVALDAGDPLALALEVVESDDNDHVSLGTASARLTFPWPAGVQEVTSDEGDFVLRYRVFDTAASGANRLRVTFLEVTVLDDGDSTSEGELRFSGGANDETSGLSVLQKARAVETLPLVGDPWTLEPEVDTEDDLTVTFAVFDEDGGALTLLDRVEQRFSFDDAWGLGEHVVTSPGECFRLRYAVAGADDDALPDLPERVPLLVEFLSATVHDDGDGSSAGEVSLTGALNDVTALQTEELSIRSGETVPLGEPLGPRTAWLAPDEDLEVALTASERDGGDADPLGTSRRVHLAADGWDLGEHDVRSANGALTATWRVDRADGPRVLVRFLQVHVIHDEEPIGPGRLVCEADVNGAATGPSLPMRAGSDGASGADDLKSDLFLGGPRWRKTVSYDPADPQVDVTFTVTELDGLSADDLLGTVRFDVSQVIGTRLGIEIFEELADSGRFKLTFLAEALD